MLEFILARYNYWVVIILMMTGLYIVFSRGNLVKTLIGLNLFQTSVFIFYITLGKVIGGTAPILVEDKKKDSHAGAGDHAAGHAESHSEAPPGFVAETAGAHLTTAPEADHHTQSVNPPPTGDGPAAGPGESLHLSPPGAPANALFPPAETGQRLGEAIGGEGYGEMMYSNPLPHVLILTAIVVGVATTAVGLSLAVRIREAYGTVEEDALEEIDNTDDLAEAAR